MSKRQQNAKHWSPQDVPKTSNVSVPTELSFIKNDFNSWSSSDYFRPRFEQRGEKILQEEFINNKHPKVLRFIVF